MNKPLIYLHHGMNNKPLYAAAWIAPTVKDLVLMRALSDGSVSRFFFAVSFWSSNGAVQLNITSDQTEAGNIGGDDLSSYLNCQAGLILL